MLTSAILLAGGNSQRISTNDKTTIVFNNKTVLEYSLDKLQNHKNIQYITIVCSEKNKNTINKFKPKYNKIHNIVLGGESRLRSLIIGFQNSFKSNITLVHDAARPLITKKLISESIDIASKYKSGIPVIHQTDSTYVVSNKILTQSLDRSNIIGSQTPQAYNTKMINQLLEVINIKKSENLFNDLPELLLSNNITPYTFTGEKYNIKLTFDDDINIMSKILEK